MKLTTLSIRREMGNALPTRVLPLPRKAIVGLMFFTMEYQVGLKISEHSLDITVHSIIFASNSAISLALRVPNTVRKHIAVTKRFSKCLTPSFYRPACAIQHRVTTCQSLRPGRVRVNNGPLSDALCHTGSHPIYQISKCQWKPTNSFGANLNLAAKHQPYASAFRR